MYRVQHRSELSSKWGGTSGTSASTPVAAGMFSNINAARLAAGKGSIGWINPVLYMYASLFVNDVTKGNNLDGALCPQGFYATPGWDPTTGLGSINYGKLEAVMVSLGNVNSMLSYPSKNPASNVVPPPTAYPVSKPSATPRSSPTNVPSKRPTVPEIKIVTKRPSKYPTKLSKVRKPSRRPLRSRTKRPSRSPLVVEFVPDNKKSTAQPSSFSPVMLSPELPTSETPSPLPSPLLRGDLKEKPSSGTSFPSSTFPSGSLVSSSANVIKDPTREQGTITLLLIY